MAQPFAWPRRRRCATPLAAAIRAPTAACRTARRRGRWRSSPRAWAASCSSTPSSKSGLTPRTAGTRRCSSRVAKSLAGTRMIYLMANQLPLLDVAGPAIGFVNGSARTATFDERQHRPRRLRSVVTSARLDAVRDGADDRRRLLRSERPPELSGRSEPSRRELARVPYRQRDRVQRHDVLQLRRASRQGSLRLRPQSPCAEHDCAGISGRESRRPSIAGLSGACPEFISMPDSRL